MATSAISRISLSKIENRLSKGAGEAEAKMNIASDKVGKGVQYLTKTELSDRGKYQDFISNLSDIGRTKVFIDSLQQTGVIMSQTDLVLEQMIDNLSDARSFLTQAISPSGKNMQIDKTIGNHLDRFLSQLNSKHSDKCLFAGYTTEISPVDKVSAKNDSLVYDTTSGKWIATTNYARGDMSARSVQVDDNINVQFNIPASDQAFAKVIGALNQVLKEPGNDKNLLEASKLLDDAFRGIISLRTEYALRTTVVEKGIENWTDRNTSLQALYQKEYGDEMGAMSELMVDINKLKYHKEQTFSLLALLMKNKPSILDKIL